MARTALIFPGQGSQTIGMAKDFFENFRESRLIFEEASDTLNINIQNLCFEGPLEDLILTENLQPALLTAEIAMLMGLRIHLDLTIGAFAGHSLGEYAAHVAAGSLPFAEAVKLTRFRGAAMQQAVPVGVGTMAAIIGLEPSIVEGICRQAQLDTDSVVSPANFNAPGQIVIAGTVQGIQRATAIVKDEPAFKKAKCIPLQVSAPFHCSLMEPARKAMTKPLSTTTFRPPSAPIIQNLTASASEQALEFGGTLIDQIVSPVRWQESMEQLSSLHIDRVIEVGPGSVLTGLLKRINRELPCHSLNTVEGLKQLPKA